MSRRPLRPNSRRAAVARSESLPAPVQGLDAVSPLAEMPPLRAVDLENWFPQAGYLELRRGHVVHADTGTGQPVESVMAYHGLTANKLFAASATKIFDVSSGTAVDAVTGLTSAQWQHVNFSTTGGKFLWICNGVDAERYYDGSAWATATLTGVSAGDVVQACVFKGRLFFALKNSLDAGYLPTDSIQGAVAKFPLGGLMNKGGTLQVVGTWALDGGDGPDDYIVFISSRGQVAVYTGSNPAGGGDFALRGVYDIGAPIGRRCLVRTAGDLAILCQDGILPLSRALVTDRAAAGTVALTARIQPLVADAARQFGGLFGWQILGYPRGTAALLNVPRITGQYQTQYVMNTVTGAWTHYTGWNANAWEVWQDRLFFGGNDGRVCEADRSGADRGAPIRARSMQAYNYFRARGRLKTFKLARAILTTDGAIRPEIGIAVDYAPDAPTQPTAVFIAPAAKYDSGVEYDSGALYAAESSVSTSWTSVGATGYAASVIVRTLVAPPGAESGEVAAPLLRLNAVDVIHEPGGMV